MRLFSLSQSTEIGKAVNGLRKHGSDIIRQLAKTLIAYELDLSLRDTILALVYTFEYGIEFF